MRQASGRLVQLDCRLFDAIARRGHTRALDWLLPRLSRAANNSLLWLVAGGAMTAAGGRRGKRAALRGVGSIGLTSLFVNQLVKRVVRRPRPDLRHVPAVRRLHAQPLTTSFPSGHAASAAAFAVGASSELPKARVPLALAAGAVGYSRSYVGVHYPLDVLVGAAIGASIGALTRLQWPLLPADVEEIPPTRAPVELEPRPDGEGVVLVVNQDAGNPLTSPSADELRRRLPRARVVELDEPKRLPELLRSEARDAAVIGVAGGDGTTATAAEVACELGLPLLLIPSGTLNHLGRDLRVESADDALDALAHGHGARIDLGVICDRPFVNSASFGAYTRMLSIRGELQKRIGRWPAHFAAVAVALFRAEPLDLELDGSRRRAWMVFVGNGRHEPAGFAPSWRPALDDGLLDVRVLSGEHPLARLRLLASILTGRLTRSVAYEQRCVRELEVRTGYERMTLSRDGDGFEGAGSFTIRKTPRALAVYAPAPPGETRP